MPGTGPLRRSSEPARKKAIVGKSRIAAKRHQGPAFVFGLWGLSFMLRSWQNIGTSKTGRFGIDPAQQKPGKPDFKLLVFNGFEPYRPPRQTRTDKQFVFSPGDDAGGMNPTRHHLGVVQLLYSAPIGANRMAIKFTGTTHSKGLMGTLLVKLLAPQFQAILIDSTQTLQFQADITMQALMRPVVLGVAGSASLQINTQSYPPGRQPAQAVHCAPAGKGAAVVAADSLR